MGLTPRKPRHRRRACRGAGAQPHRGTEDLVGSSSCPRRLIGLGVVPETRAGRLFRDVLGEVNQRLAGTADEVWFVVAGLPQRLR